MTAAAHLAGRDVIFDLLDQQLDEAVGDQDTAARLNDVELGVVDANALRGGRRTGC